MANNKLIPPPPPTTPSIVSPESGADSNPMDQFFEEPGSVTKSGGTSENPMDQFFEEPKKESPKKEPKVDEKPALPVAGHPAIPAGNIATAYNAANGLPPAKPPVNPNPHPPVGQTISGLHPQVPKMAPMPPDSGVDKTLRYLEQQPVVGNIVKTIHQAIQNTGNAVGQAAQQAYKAPGEAVQNPIGAALLGGRNLAGGVVGGAEDIAGPLAHFIVNTARKAHGQQPISYGQLVGGKPFQERVAEYGGNIPGTEKMQDVAATGRNLGSIVPAILPVGAAEKGAGMVLSNLIKNPTVARIITDALVGAGSAGVYGAGQRDVYNQPTTPSNVLGDLLVGGGLGTAAGTAGAVAKGAGKALKLEETPRTETAKPISNVLKAETPQMAPVPESHYDYNKGRAETDVSREPEETPKVSQVLKEPGQIPAQKKSTEIINKEEATSQRNAPTLKSLGLDKSSPRYRTSIPNFESDLDKALYVVGNPKTKSGAHDKFMQFIKGQTGWDDATILKNGKKVRQHVKSFAEQSDEQEFDVPDSGVGAQESTQKGKVETPELAPIPKSEMKQERVEENIDPQVQAIADKYDIPVPKAAEELPPTDKATQWLGERIPRKDMEETHQAEGIDWEDPNKQLIKARRPLIRDGRLMLDENGNPRWAKTYVSGRVENINGVQKFRVLRHYSKKKTLGEAAQVHGTELNRETLDKETSELTPTEIDRLKRQAPHIESGKTQPVQRLMWEKHKSIIDKAASGDIEGAAKEAEEAMKVQKEENPFLPSTNLYAGGPIIPQAIFVAKRLGQSADAVSRAMYGESLVDAGNAAIFHEKTHDIIARHDPELNNAFVRNEAQELASRMGLNWRGKFAEEAHDAMRKMDPSEILHSEDTAHWTPEQREAVAAAKTFRQKNLEIQKQYMEDYGEDMPEELAGALTDYAALLAGKRLPGADLGDHPIETLARGATELMASGAFEKNPKLSELQMTHTPLQSAANSALFAAGKAYKALAFNKEVQKFFENNPLTVNNARSESSKIPIVREGNRLISGAVNKALSRVNPALRAKLEKSSVSEYNAAHFALSEAYHENSAADVEQFIRDVNNGTRTQSLEKRIQVASSMQKGIREALPSDEFDRGFVQRSPLGRAILAPFTNFSSGLMRYQMKQLRTMLDSSAAPRARAEAVRSLATFEVARAMLGGTPLPPEIEEPLEQGMASFAPDQYIVMKEAMHIANIPRWLNADISRHTSAGWKVGTYPVIPAVVSAVNAFRKGDVVKGGARASELIGGPVGGLGGRTVEAGEKALQKEEEIPVFMRSGFGATNRIAVGHRPYGAVNAARDIAITGEDKDKANFEELHRIMHTLKEAGTLTPERTARLKRDFPIGNILEGEAPKKLKAK